MEENHVIPSDSQETSLEMYIQTFFSLEVKMVKILTVKIVNENEALKTAGHFKSESRPLPPPCKSCAVQHRHT